MNPTDIRVLSTHAAMDVLNELGPKFERATGLRLSIGYDPAKAVKRQIENGAAFDVAIVTRPVFDDLAAQGKMLPETRADIGRSGLGLAVRKGAAKPDIATTEAFKRALLAAKSVVRSTEGTSGIYFETLLERLGIAEAMRDKIVLGPSGRVAELVARGEADMADPADPRTPAGRPARNMSARFRRSCSSTPSLPPASPAPASHREACRGLRHGFGHAGSRRAVQSRGA